MQDKDVNINVIRSVWRRTKKGHIKVRDLQPQKDVKGGGGVAGNMKTSRSIAEAPLQIPNNPPLSPWETPRPLAASVKSSTRRYDSKVVRNSSRA